MGLFLPSNLVTPRVNGRCRENGEAGERINAL